MRVLSQFNISNVAAVITDPHQTDNPIVEYNERFLSLTGYGRAEVLGRNARFLTGPGTDPRCSDRLALAVHHRRPEALEILNYKKDGTPFVNSLTIFPIFDGGDIAFFIGLLIEVSDRGDGARANRKAIPLQSVLPQASAFFENEDNGP